MLRRFTELKLSLHSHDENSSLIVPYDIPDPIFTSDTSDTLTKSLDKGQSDLIIMSETEAVEIRRKAFKQKSLFESITDDDVEKYQEAFSVCFKFTFQF